MNSDKNLSIDALPDNPLRMPPPHWRSGGAIFHLTRAIQDLEELLRNLPPIHAATDSKLDDYYAKYPEEESSPEAMDEFCDITDELSELESGIRLAGELACLMSAIEAEDQINRFCVYNLPRDIAESLEKLSPCEKLVIVAAAVGKPSVKGTAVLEGLRQLSSWRNAFAHGHCVDRPTKSLRHNHLIHPDEYPGVPSTLKETRELVGALVRVSDYLCEISINPYTSGGSAEIDLLRESLKKFDCYQLEGNNWVYDVLLVGAELERIAQTVRAVVSGDDAVAKKQLQDLVESLNEPWSKILRLEFGVGIEIVGDRSTIMQELVMTRPQFAKERARALTQLCGWHQSNTDETA